MKYTIFLVFALIIVPGITHAAVRITEVAWMGTVSSQYSEWLELYNDGDSSVNLAGWKLLEGDGSTLFTLTKTIPADGYLLVERTTASAPDAVPGIDDEAGPFGSGGLANTGEDLSLVDTTGASIDTLDFASGWPAGDATTKHTMQWDGSKWITAEATPKAGVSGEADTSTTSTTTDDTADVEVKDPFPIPPVSPNQPHIEFITPNSVYVGVPYQYKAHPVFEYSYGIDTGDYYWNMGDGTMVRQQRFEPITHTYAYPGTYTISFKYTDPMNDANSLIGNKKVTVATPAFTIATINDNALQIKNTSSVPIDFSGWSIVLPNKHIALPPLTIVAEKATVTIPFTILSITNAAHLAIADPSGNIITTTDPVVTPSSTESTTAYVSEDDAPYEAPDLAVDTPVVTTANTSTTPIRNRTKSIIFGAVALFVIVLSILLERFKAQQEYSSQ